MELEESEIRQKKQELEEAIAEEQEASSRVASLRQELEDEGVDLSDVNFGP